MAQTQASSQQVTMSVDDFLKIVDEAFSFHVTAQVGNYFGEPSAHLDGKADMLNEIKKELEKKR